MEKDFSYLYHPAKLPRAYEKSLLEIARRRKFRKLIDEECLRIKAAITREKEARSLFMNEYGRLLPTEFLPQLKEQAPTLKLEGNLKDYELPEVNDDHVTEADIFGFKRAASSSSGEDLELRKKFTDL